MIAKGIRSGICRFLCLACPKWFCVNHKQKEPLAWIPWIDGTSLRKLSNQRKKQSHLSFYRQAKQEIISLPNNTELSKKHCSVFSGILNLDGIYVKIAGYKKSIPFIYGMDFLLHDPIVSLLSQGRRHFCLPHNLHSS